MLDLISALGDIASGLQALPALVAPWRWLCSSGYRREKHAEWRRHPWLRAFWVAGALLIATIEIGVLMAIVHLAFAP